MASVQEKAGNTVMDLQIAKYATIDLLSAAMDAHFMSVADGATACSKYQNMCQLPTKMAKE